MPDQADPQGLRQVTRLGVYGLAIEDGSILLARISARVPGAEGRWTLPGGGMRWGETPHETLAREMWEETGLVPRIGPPVEVLSRVVERDGRSIHSIQTVFSVAAHGPPRVTEVDGTVDAAAWHRLDTLEALQTGSLVDHVIGLLDR